MKALVLNKPLDLEISDVPDPGAPPAGFVRVKVDTVGICGSDVHYYEHGRIGDFVVEKPMILGHETAGVIEATGEGVDGLTVGDHVAMEPGVSCGDCGYCESGRYNLCADMAFWATPPYDGSLAEYVVHPARFTYKLPIGMSLEEGALIEPLSVAVKAPIGIYRRLVAICSCRPWVTMSPMRWPTAWRRHLVLRVVLRMASPAR